MRIKAILAIIILYVLSGCGSTNPPHPGWVKLVGNRVSIWLPGEYHQIDIDNLSKESAALKNTYPNVADVYDDIDIDPGKVALWAVNFETGDNIFIYPNTPEDEVQLYQNQKENAFAMTKAIRSAKKIPFAGARGFSTDAHHNGKSWSIYGLSEETQFPKAEVIFQDSLKTIQNVP